MSATRVPHPRHRVGRVVAVTLVILLFSAVPVLAVPPAGDCDPPRVEVPANLVKAPASVLSNFVILRGAVHRSVHRVWLHATIDSVTRVVRWARKLGILDGGADEPPAPSRGLPYRL